MKKLKCGRVVFVGLLLMAIGLGCSIHKPIEINDEEGNSDQMDTKIISDLILFQYGKELNTWKALSPKMSD